MNVAYDMHPVTPSSACFKSDDEFYSLLGVRGDS